jgi:flavin reductase (DIM6/NTAB) family NADH-FMN oxidoreductase RutF
VNASALESWDDEFPIAGVTKAASRVVKPPRVAESPVSFECKTHSVVRIQGDSLVGHSDIVIGRVVAIHVKGEYITPDGVSLTILLCERILTSTVIRCAQSSTSRSSRVSSIYRYNARFRSENASHAR